MTDPLRPVGGSPAEVLDALRPWVRDGGEPIVIRSSGSTGEPKDVVLSHAAVVASAHASLDRLGGPGTWLLAMPVTGIGGLQVLVRALLSGAEPVLAEGSDLIEAVEAMPGPRRYTSLVPTQLHRVAAAGRLASLARLDAVLVGGAALDDELRAAAESAGVRIVRTYGMSETAGGCVYDGVPLDGVEVSIGEDRQILLRGPVLFDRYADPVATEAAMRDGWFATADLGEFLPDGRLRVLGRGDDVAVSGGVNVPLAAVTRALKGLEAVGDALAVAVPDDEWGQRVVACVVPADAVCLDGLRLDEVRDGVEAAGLPRAWAPRDVVLVDGLPLLGNGKVDRLAVRRQAVAAVASSGSGATPPANSR